MRCLGVIWCLHDREFWLVGEVKIKQPEIALLMDGMSITREYMSNWTILVPRLTATRRQVRILDRFYIVYSIDLEPKGGVVWVLPIIVPNSTSEVLLGLFKTPRTSQPQCWGSLREIGFHKLWTEWTKCYIQVDPWYLCYKSFSRRNRSHVDETSWTSFPILQI